MFSIKNEFENVLCCSCTVISPGAFRKIVVIKIMQNSWGRVWEFRHQKLKFVCYFGENPLVALTNRILSYKMHSTVSDIPRELLNVKRYPQPITTPTRGNSICSPILRFVPREIPFNLLLSNHYGLINISSISICFTA